jgi:hypothetical protein
MPRTIFVDAIRIPQIRPQRSLFRGFVAIAAMATVLVSGRHAEAASPEANARSAPFVEPLDAASLAEIKTLYKSLIDAENRHDLAAVEPFVWVSPSALFVAKTATAAEGNWAGFWGDEVLLHHLGELYQGPFEIDPDYSQEKVVGLTRDVTETYAPAKITVTYAGQTPVPKPFLMILEWVRTADGWKMATDIALPIPPAPRS